jgi:4-methyl-5(b-hydroxyethyl)-thiazole monophosphate biosynthesis
MAKGYEEGETFTIVDLLRRAGITCQTFALDDELIVEGMHHMKVKADKPFGKEIEDYDVLILPGGRPGGANLKESKEVIEMVKKFNAQGKWLAAMCSGTLVLKDADVIEGKKMTGYTGYEEKLIGAEFIDEVVVVDANLITSQGPATPYPFAFAIAKCLGKNIDEMKYRLMYNFAGGKSV